MLFVPKKRAREIRKRLLEEHIAETRERLAKIVNEYMILLFAVGVLGDIVSETVLTLLGF